MHKDVITKSPFAILVTLTAILLMYGKAAAAMTPQTLGYGNLYSVALSPDGKKLATGSQTGTVRLWDCATGKVVMTLPTNFPVTALSFSPNGATLFSGSIDTFPKFCLWNTITGSKKSLDSVQVNRDNSFTVIDMTSTQSSWALRWDVSSNTIPLIRFIKGSLLVSSQDGHKILAQTKNYPMRLSDTRLGFISSFSTWTVNAAAFCPDDPDGLKILIATNKNACLWDVRNNKILRTFGDTGNVRSVAVSSDGSKIITSFGSNAIIWNAANAEAIRSISMPSEVATVSFSPDETSILTTSDDNTIRLWGASDGTLIREFTGHTPSPLSVAFSPDNSKIITGAKAPDNTMRLWDIASGSIIKQFHGHKNAIISVAFSPDGAKILTGSLDSTAQLWDAASGAKIASFKGHTNEISSVAFSPDGKKIITGSYDSSVCLWSVDSQSLIRKLAVDSGAITAVAFSSDGNKIATGSWAYRLNNHNIRACVWDVNTGDLIMSSSRYSSDVSSVDFSSDGTKLLTSSGWNYNAVATIWNIESGDTIWQPTRDSPSLVSKYAAFSPDNSSILTGGKSQNLILWNVTNKTIIKTIIIDTYEINSLAFSHDGAMISAGASDGIVRLWNLRDTSSVKRPVNVANTSTGFRLYAAERNVLVFQISSQSDLLPSTLLHLYTSNGVLVGKYSGIPGSKGTISFHLTCGLGRGAYICRFVTSRTSARSDQMIVICK